MSSKLSSSNLSQKNRMLIFSIFMPDCVVTIRISTAVECNMYVPLQVNPEFEILKTQKEPVII